MGKVYQSCYTNATQEVGSVVSSGWQTVAASPDLPLDAGKRCTYLQNLNSTIQSRMLDEKGQVLNLYEISGDEKYFYVMRTQYGLVDRVGRPNMFSHAYILSLDDAKVLGDPNLLLSIDKSNFKASEEEAAAWDGQLVRREFLTLDASLLKIAGMDWEQYAILVRCVYAQMSERKSPRPLYIQYDGTEPQLHAMLYCIYYGIPYYMRKRLSIASCPAINDAKKNLIFTCDAKSKERYFIPQTGENNILDSRTQRKIDRYGYIDHAVKNLPAAEYPDFFIALEGFATSLGDSSSVSNELVLKVAYQCYNHIERNAEGMPTINFNAFSDEELESCLSDALRSGLYGAQSNMGNQIARLLSIFNRRGLVLSETNEETLDEWIANSDNDMLRRAGLEYRVHQLRILPPEKTVNQLLDMPVEIFKLYSAELCTSPEGEKLLDLYFSKLGSRDMPWEQIKNLWSMSGIVSSRDKTIDAIQAAAWTRYCEDVAQGSDVMSSYQEYCEIMKAMLCPGQLTGNEQFHECMISAKEEFWQHQSLAAFRFQDKELYQFMDCEGIPVCRQFMELIDLAKGADHVIQEKYLKTIFQFFSSHASFQDGVKENAVKELVGYLSEQCEENYIRWVKAFADGAEFVGEDANGLMRYMYALYKNTVQFNAQELIRNLRPFLILEQHDAVKEQVCGIVEDACATRDTSSAPVPLDLWLLLGTQQPNCFDIISLRKPKIIGADPAAVAQGSELLKNPEYQEAAQLYIKGADGKCPEVKTVKYWLNECRQAEKGKRTEGWSFPTKKARGDAAPQSDTIWPVPGEQDGEDRDASEHKTKGKVPRGLFWKK